MAFQLDRFVADCIAASNPADEEGSIDRLRAVYKEHVQASPEAVRAAIANDGPDEVLLHQSDRCTIYIVRVPTGIRYAPHNHKMLAFVGVFEGVEINHYYDTRTDDASSIAVPCARTAAVRPGEVLLLDAQAVHAISSEGPTRSQALHIYLGNLGANTARRLFCPRTGRAMEFTTDNYFRNAQPPQPVPDGHDQAVFFDEKTTQHAAHSKL